MGAAVGLCVQADDVDDPDLRDVLAGTRLVAVRMMSGIWNASSRGSSRTTIRRSARSSALQASSTASLNPGGTAARLKSIRAVSGSMLPPVTSAPKSRKTTPHSTCSPEWVRISAVRRSSSTAPRTAGADRGQRVALGGNQVDVVALARVHDPGLHAAPEQDARGPAAGRRLLGRRRTGPARSRRGCFPGRPHPIRAASGRQVQAGASCSPSRAYSAAGPDVDRGEDTAQPWKVRRGRWRTPRRRARSPGR